MRGLRGWFSGFLVGVFSTLVIIDFRGLELWQRSAVLMGLAALIGWTLLESRRGAPVPDGTAGPRREPEGKPAGREEGPVKRAQTLEDPVSPPPKPPEPPWGIKADHLRPVETVVRPEVEVEDGVRLESRPEEPPEVPASSSAFPEKLPEVWESYLSRGDGCFTVEGLSRFLAEAGLSGEILPGEVLGAGEGLLAVDFGDGHLYLLPDFGKTVRSVAQWFHAPTAGSRLARINRVVEPAIVHRTPSGLELKKPGVVE